MSNLKANLKDAGGYLEEETGETLHNPKMAQKGRDLRNEGRIQKGEFPKMTKPGTTKKKEDKED